MDYFQIDNCLNNEQKALARAIDRMIEGSTYYTLLYFCSYENAASIVNPRISGLPIPSIFSSFVANKMAKAAEKRLASEGMLRHPRDVVSDILKRDLLALNQLLGEKKFFFGMRPTVPDFTFFGHLGVAYHLPFDHPMKVFIQQEEFKKLAMLIERMKLHYWKEDWPKSGDD